MNMKVTPEGVEAIKASKTGEGMLEGYPSIVLTRSHKGQFLTLRLFDPITGAILCESDPMLVTPFFNKSFPELRWSVLFKIKVDGS